MDVHIHINYLATKSLSKPHLQEAWLFSDLCGEATLGALTVSSLMDVNDSSKKINQVEKKNQALH